MKIFLILSIAAFLLSGALPAKAAMVLIEPMERTIGINQRLAVSFFLDTENENDNAFTGAWAIPADLRVDEIRTVGSIVDYWVESPRAMDGKVRGAGMIPGGYVGKRGLLFTVIATAESIGFSNWEQEELSVLRNDGTGSADDARTRATAVKVIAEPQVVLNPVVLTEDGVAPEAFVPIVTKDEEAFDEEPVIIFYTQDKGSGLDHYEVKIGENDYVAATSPYSLSGVRSCATIYIKAVDRLGNERVETISYNVMTSRSGFLLIIGTIVLAIVLATALALWRKIHDK